MKEKDNSEHCQSCGSSYYRELGESWWKADDALWNKIYGKESGLRCPKCFANDCREKGIHIYWRAVISDPEHCFFCIQLLDKGISPDNKQNPS